MILFGLLETCHESEFCFFFFYLHLEDAKTCWAWGQTTVIWVGDKEGSGDGEDGETTDVKPVWAIKQNTQNQNEKKNQGQGLGGCARERGCSLGFIWSTGVVVHSFDASRNNSSRHSSTTWQGLSRTQGTLSLNKKDLPAPKTHTMKVQTSEWKSQDWDTIGRLF